MTFKAYNVGITFTAEVHHHETIYAQSADDAKSAVEQKLRDKYAYRFGEVRSKTVSEGK